MVVQVRRGEHAVKTGAASGTSDGRPVVGPRVASTGKPDRVRLPAQTHESGRSRGETVLGGSADTGVATTNSSASRLRSPPDKCTGQAASGASSLTGTEDDWFSFSPLSTIGEKTAIICTFQHNRNNEKERIISSARLLMHFCLWPDRPICPADGQRRGPRTTPSVVSKHFHIRSDITKLHVRRFS